ncbi:MAG: 5-(carboxyamino)imidazole ribonucleotide mutase [Chloroflexota bacterium]|nr:5-(carboxyamino)imidazole ribonucleotide mutase [Chloroflexota bacterium]
MKRVLILMGSESDQQTLQSVADTLGGFGVAYEWWRASAHRNIDEVRELVSGARDKGFGVVIAAAGMAAALPGVCAALTTLPVIGIPLTSSSSPLDGVDALHSVVQMPPGFPVATVAIDGARNAALLAVQILGVEDSALAEKVAAERASWEPKRVA